MKIILVLSLLSLSLSAFSMSDKIVDECKEAAVLKLHFKAQELGADLDQESIEKLDEEKKVLSGSYLVWFKADAYRKKDSARIFVTASMEKQILPLKKPCE